METYDDTNNCYLKGNCSCIDCGSPRCLRLHKVNRLFDAALFTDEQRKPKKLVLDKDESDKRAFLYLKSICEDILGFIEDGNNLYIHSNICGNGKTAWALRLVQAYINRIWLVSELRCRALFISVPKFLLELKSNLSQKSEYISYIKENVEKCDVVIWDDIGTKSITPFESENLFSIIDSRISSKKSNIFTSNLSDEELHKVLGDRLASRICNTGNNIEFFGADKRGLNL